MLLHRVEYDKCECAGVSSVCCHSVTIFCFAYRYPVCADRVSDVRGCIILECSDFGDFFIYGLSGCGSYDAAGMKIPFSCPIHEIKRKIPYNGEDTT